MLVTHEGSDAVHNEANNRKAERVAEVERSLRFTKDFLENLESPDDAGRERVEEIAYSLERELDRLRTSKRPDK